MFGDPERSAVIAYSAAFIGLISIGAWISVPFFPVPFTFQTLFIMLSGMVMKRSAVIPVSLYVMLGVLGLPLFHSGVAGPGVLLGPTGGYLAGFVAGSLVIGLAFESGSAGVRIIGLLAGLGVIYLMGIAWLILSLGVGPVPAIAAGLLPFIPGEVLKVSAAYTIWRGLR